MERAVIGTGFLDFRRRVKKQQNSSIRGHSDNGADRTAEQYPVQVKGSIEIWKEIFEARFL